MTEEQKQAEIIGTLQNLETVLRNTGSSDDEINQTMLDLMTQVEMGVIDALVDDLSEEKRTQLEVMTEQNKSMEEITTFLGITSEEMSNLELKTFKAVINNYIASLPPRN